MGIGSCLRGREGERSHSAASWLISAAASANSSMNSRTTARDVFTWSSSADALADVVRHEIFRLPIAAAGLVFRTPQRRLAQKQLQRHRQRARAVRAAPRVSPRRAQLTCVLAGAALGTHGVARGCGCELLLDERRCFRFARHQPHRAGPRAGRAECHHRGHLTTRDDAARREHGHRADRLDGADHFRHQHQRRDFAAVAAGFRAFGNDDVDARLHLPDCMLFRADQRRDGDTLCAPRSIIDCGGTPSALAMSLIGCENATSISREDTAGSRLSSRFATIGSSRSSVTP